MRIICVVGRTASGKDTVARYLQKKYNLKPVCSYTTRELRAGEENGREHWFISEEEMKEILKRQDVVAYTKIEDPEHPEVKGYEYCATMENLMSADIYVIDPKGIAYMKENFPDVIIDILYVYAPQAVREKRSLKRDETSQEKFIDREISENRQFTDFETLGSIIKYRYSWINNTKCNLEELYEATDGFYEEVCRRQRDLCF